MGSRGSNASAKRLNAQLKSLDTKIAQAQAEVNKADYAMRMVRGAIQSYRGDAKENAQKELKDARRAYMNARNNFTDLMAEKRDVQDKIRRLDDAKIAKQRGVPNQQVPGKAGVNGFGERTSREITSGTYERAQRRLARDVSLWMRGR